VEFEFLDFKKVGISEEVARDWCLQVGADGLINKRGTTWKKLDEGVRNSELDLEAAVRLICENNSLVKRPVLVKDGKVVAVGFEGGGFEGLV